MSMKAFIKETGLTKAFRECEKDRKKYGEVENIQLNPSE